MPATGSAAAQLAAVAAANMQKSPGCTPPDTCSGLLYCMEYLEENLEEWLGEELQVGWRSLPSKVCPAIAAAPGAAAGLIALARACPALAKALPTAMHFGNRAMHPTPPILQPYGDDDYLVFDCPGQIELYSHLSVFRSFVDYLRRDGWCGSAGLKQRMLPELAACDA